MTRALQVTPEICAAVYDCLRAFEPFRNLRLPDSEAVEFHVKQRRDAYGEYVHTGVAHSLTISASLIGSFDSLAQVVAHEMLHLAQAEHSTQTSSQHNAAFRRLARSVCQKMVWDERAFIG